MSLVVDPIYPWHILWALLQDVSGMARTGAALAALAALLLPILLRGHRGRMLGLSLGGVGLYGLILLLRESWSIVLARESDGDITGFFNAILLALWLLTLLLAPPLLAGISIRVYLDAANISNRRKMAVIGLRALAFLLVILAILRPAFAFADPEQARQQIIIVVDRSRSMTVRDEQGKISRWEMLQKMLDKSNPALKRLLEEQQTEVSFYHFSDKTGTFDPADPGEADGKRTDFGSMLQTLYSRREGRMKLRGILILSDGADNGLPGLAFSEANSWRNIPCPVSTFACGNPATTQQQNDVAITSITTSPTPFVPVKGKLTVKVNVDAHGFADSKVRVRMYLDDVEVKSGTAAKGSEVIPREVALPLTKGNEIVLTADAPSKPGEVKVKVVVEPPEEDALPLNNFIETFVTVSKEGISVLLVDKQRAFEPAFICDALARDPRMRITPVWLRGGKAIAGATGKLFRFDEQPYDVIILGDVTVDQVRDVDANAISSIAKLVGNGSGLMMLGGYNNYARGGWDKSELKDMFPVDWSSSGQHDEPVAMNPTQDGMRLARYLLRLDDSPAMAATWKKLAKLDGMTRLKFPPKPTGTETILATADDESKSPLLIMKTYARKGARGDAYSRVLAFAGDTTYRWVRNEEGQKLHMRFWRQVVVWLAKQEDAAGNVWVRPETRRLPVGRQLDFLAGMRGKGGGAEIKDVTFRKVEVVGPEGDRFPVKVIKGRTENRGTLDKARTLKPGIYRVVVDAKGVDPSGGVIEGEASSRVIVYDEDREMSRPAADPEFLRRLAASGGGQTGRIETLPDFLARLAQKPQDSGTTRRIKKPNWTPEDQPNWNPSEKSGFLMAFFFVFVLVVSVEWLLRRRWGMI